MSEWEIRPFAEGDRADLLEVFARAGEGATLPSIWGHLPSEADVYLTPYMDLEPQSLFVAVVDGAIAGYLTGCLESSAMPSESARLDQAVRRHRLYARRAPAAFFARALLDLARGAARSEPAAGDFADPRWPSHLHINLVPQARGIGIGTALMDRWLTRVRESGSPGCHLQTPAENSGAVRFFGRAGFVRHGNTPLIPGVRAGGRRVRAQTMVWSPHADG